MRFNTHAARAKRRGQALILAVLVMLLAALTGAIFIAVVSLNLNQTARSTDKNAAIANAQAGMDFVNSQLVSSLQGERWSPVLPASAATDPTYYSAVDEAQGWKAQGFVKYPDPSLPAPDNAPRFLAKVEPAPATEPDKQGMLKITVFGLSDDVSTAWHRLVAYKPTVENSGPFSYARYDSNFDLERNRLPEARVTEDPVATDNELSVSSTDGFTVGHNVLISDQNALPDANGIRDTFAVVTAVDAVARTISVRRFNAGVDYTSNALIRPTSTLSDGLATIDADGVSATNPENTLFPVRVAASPTLPIQLKFNGGLSLLETSNIVLANGDDDRLKVAGRIFNSNTLGGSGTDNALLTDNFGTGPVVRIPSSTEIEANTTNTLQQIVVEDADIFGSPTSGRNEQLLSPPAWDEAAERYRKLTQYAAPADGSAYGYGPGLYINNVSDVEKVGVGAAARVLENQQLHRLWQRKSFQIDGATAGNITYTGTNAPITTGGEAFRLSYPRLGVDTYAYPSTAPTDSLEQRGIRGWVSPWEFRPRGTLIELRGDEIIVTRDDRSDAVANAPDPSKVWLNQAGAPIASNYRLRIDNTGQRHVGAAGSDTAVGTAPAGGFNGVIMAEGNVRVRGYWNSTTPLTIASNSNIYVDGALRKTGDGRVALLAKRNVIVNPTQVTPVASGVAQPDIAAATNATLAARLGDAGTNTISFDLAAGTSNTFKVGDKVVVPGDPQNTAYTVNEIALTGTSGTLTVTPALPTAPVLPDPENRPDTGAPIRHLSEAPVASDATNQYYYRLADTSQTLAREVRFANQVPANSGFFFSSTMAGERAAALNIQPEPLGTVGTNFAVKQVASAAIQNVTAVDKDLELTGPPAEYDFTKNLLDIDGTAPTDVDATETLQKLRTQVYEQPAGTNRWTLTIPATAPATMDSVPARFLAQMSRAFDATNTSYDVPITSAIGFFSFNAAPPIFRSDDPVTPGTANPALKTTVGSSYLPTGDEAVKYVDARFYQLGTTPAQRPLTFTRPGDPGDIAPPDEMMGPQAFDSATADAVLNTVGYRPQPKYESLPLAPVRFGFPKIERANGTSMPFSDPAALAILDIPIEATIYAHSGSFFVVPQPVLAAPDNDGDGTVNDPEQRLSERTRRLNYNFTVVGNIAQNFSPTAQQDYDEEPDPDGLIVGATNRWLDAQTYPTGIVAASPFNNPQGWQFISYTASPIGAAELNSTGLATNLGLRLPVTPDLIYAN